MKTVLSTAAASTRAASIARYLKMSVAAAIGIVCSVSAVHAQTKSVSTTARTTAILTANKYTMTALPLDEANDMNAAGLIVGADDGMGAVYVNGTVRLLASPTGYTEVRAVAVSSNGIIVGTGKSGTATRALYWDSYTGPAKDMSGISNFTQPLAVNASGVVVGYFNSTDRNMPHAFRWTLSTGYQDIHTTGFDLSQAFGISNSGYIAGYLNFGQNQFYAGRWYPNGAKGTIARGDGMRAFDDGRILGTMVTDDHQQVSVIWDLSNTAQRVGPDAATHTVYDISSNGRMVGSTTSTLAWTTLNGSAVTLLPTPTGNYSVATRVSACGAIMGAYGAGLNFHPVVWTRLTCDQSTTAGLAL